METIKHTLYPGRPVLLFSESSERTKRRKTAKLSSTFETEEPTLTATKNLKQEGKKAAAKLITEALTTPTRATKIYKAWQKSRKIENITPLTPNEALPIIIEAKEGKHTYLVHRRAAEAHFADIYPSYNKLREAKLHFVDIKELVSDEFLYQFYTVHFL
ncbi:hypothetical protein RN001_013270 [Aquatica leii]|uniref:Uncharacterized protein n=1 Tax=Aquatica leii TaxID=1421715 RepID=A0AAN7NW82_9COLE|nr:hypothetical protein RN001_013270 [Aquatica leii]